MSVEKIGRYEISGELGKGAMGVVYKATDPTIGRTVALKTMRMDLHAEKHDEMLQRFQHEARAAGALNHPNIVTIYDAAEADGLFYIAMECIEGTTLASMLHKRRSLSAQEIVDIGTQICAGLQYAHFRKVVHRDIKPQNIMISPGNTVKIMDFGIAKAGASLTHTGEVLGTPHYMSPEQVKGQDLDGRSDIFSLGVVLYEMVTGEKPFAGQNVTSVIYKIVNEQPVAPRELDVSIHPGLSMIVTKCLAKDPEDRYQEASDLATALKSYKIVSVPDPHGAYARPAPSSAPRPSARPPIAAPTMATRPMTMSRSAASPKAGVAPATSTKEIPAAKHPSNPQARKTLTLFVILALTLAAGALGIRRYRNYLPTIASLTPHSTPSTTSTPTTPKPSSADPGISANVRNVPDNSAKPAASTQEQSTNSSLVPSGIGDLRITSNPPGAQVSVDGVTQDYYVTPFNTPPLKAGPHTLIATIAGLPAQTRQVEVTPSNRNVIDFQLTGDKAIYNIGSAPAGAEILIDGVAVGARTPAQIAVSAGAHKVTLRLDGFESVEVMAQGSAGESVSVTPRLQARNSVDISDQTQSDAPSLGSVARMRRPGASLGMTEARGSVIVRTRPMGVTITVDGHTIPRTTPFRFPIKPGSHTVVLQKAGFQSVTRTVQVEEGKISEIDELLLPQ
jgi:serine/threonine-protein kinase